MFNKKNGQKGFTLIELMIVVVIVGILAALAIPRFMRASTKAKQSEAKQILKQIYTMEQAYRQEKDVYWTTAAVAGSLTPVAFGTIGVEIGPTARYSYMLAVPAAGSFLATATSSDAAIGLDDDPALDIWTIDHTGSLACLSDDAIL